MGRVEFKAKRIELAIDRLTVHLGAAVRAALHYLASSPPKSKGPQRELRAF
jgi:hypothetical protein